MPSAKPKTRTLRTAPSHAPSKRDAQHRPLATPLITSLPDANALCERGQPNARAGQGVARAPLLLSQVPGAAHADIYKQLNVVSRSDRKVANCSSARSGQHGDRRAGGARNPCLARAPRRRTGTGAHNSAPSISSPRSATAS